MLPVAFARITYKSSFNLTICISRGAPCLVRVNATHAASKAKIPAPKRIINGFRMRFLRQREHVESISGGDGDVLFAVLALVRDRHGGGVFVQFGGPEFLAGFGVEGTESLVQSATDEESKPDAVKAGPPLPLLPVFCLPGGSSS